jgi:hypothetical protein
MLLIILFKNKILIEEKRIIKVDPADELDGMVALLAHTSD